MVITMISTKINFIHEIYDLIGDRIESQEKEIIGLIRMRSPNLLEFELDFMDEKEEIVYDMKEGKVVKPEDSIFEIYYFNLIKIKDSHWIFTADLYKNDDNEPKSFRLFGKISGPWPTKINYVTSPL